jgi:flagellar motor switch protein FliN/FliY
MDLLMDVPLELSVELGRARMTIQDLLGLGPGSVIELDKVAGEALDILVNDRLVARGEAVVVNDKFGVRITDIVSQSERVARLR